MNSRPNHRSRRQGFTLIELLTVIAIIGILAAILIPTVGRVRETARRTVDQSNIRQIGQAALVYASDNNGRLPGRFLTDVGRVTTGTSTTLRSFAAALAQFGGLNDATLWFSGSDQATNSEGFSTILNGDKSALVPPFGSTATLSFVAIAGLNTNLPSTTPIAFTRGLNAAGTWDTWNDTARTGGVYGNEGGHIVFLGGNVSFFRDTLGTAGNGLLTDTSGSPTADINGTVNSTTTAFVALPTDAVPTP